MPHNDDNGVDIEMHEAEGSVLGGWPALLLTVGMVLAAVYSFVPRPYPPFPPTRVHANDFLANGLAHQGARYIAVGERGVILYTDDVQGSWADASVEPDRGATLTRVRFVGEHTAIAVGHNAWIVRSTDDGKTWKEVSFNPESSDPLLDLGGPYNGELFAVGSFGQMKVSHDLGKTWQEHPLVVKEDDEEKAEAEKIAAEDKTTPESDNYDPFAAFAAGGGVQALASKHLNSITQLDDGDLFVTGERGLMLRSSDNGATWHQLDEIYKGSFYGALDTPNGGLLVYGMRGHAFISHDNGKTWQPSKIDSQQSLFIGTVTQDGTILLAGAADTVLASTDNGTSFHAVLSGESSALASIISLGQGRWLTAGEDGVVVRQAKKSSKNNQGARS